ncbi:hypothetical protein [Streptomyces sp. TBY4]|uniref:hypothetical protein n=1 Tax=Streptomyces sp. TBY4 TaxID=2962030 RepID=UPI0020B8F4DF|nr:hypothetical protein [Streptomyces sp. TBY4]MCP3760392.1 hypothetical protein [Streptomyces sp. TBY4]
MLDTSPLTAAVERFADRLRAAPQSRLQQGAAEVALDLARELSLRAQRLEAAAAGAGDGAGAAPARTMPDAGIFVVGDQLAVAGLDLAEALHGAEAGAAGRAGTRGAQDGTEAREAQDAPGAPDAAKAPSEMLDEAVRLVDQAEAGALR